MTILWAPWRKDYILGPKPSECPLCAAAQRPDEPDCLVVGQTAQALALLNRYPYGPGHLMVAPRRHVASLAELSPEEMMETGNLLQRAETALRKLYRPDGLNLGLNLGSAAGAGLAEHLHWHVVPRWEGDANFITVIGGTRVLAETLEESRQRLLEVMETQ